MKLNEAFLVVFYWQVILLLFQLTSSSISKLSADHFSLREAKPVVTHRAPSTADTDLHTTFLSYLTILETDITIIANCMVKRRVSEWE